MVDHSPRARTACAGRSGACACRVAGGDLPDARRALRRTRAIARRSDDHSRRQSGGGRRHGNRLGEDRCASPCVVALALRGGESTMSMAFDLITFDCYGTLIDWEKGIVSAFQQEAVRLGRVLDGETIVAAYHAEEPAVESEAYRPYRDVLTKTAQRVASRLGLPIEPERGGFLVESLPHWPPFTDTNPALERLVKRYRLGILSNVDDDLL